MKNKSNSDSKQLKRVVTASILTTVIMILSFWLLYMHTSSPDTARDVDCAGPTKSISAEGLVVIGEADLSCAAQSEGLQSSRGSIDIALKSVAAVSSVLNLYLLSWLYKKSR